MKINLQLKHSQIHNMYLQMRRYQELWQWKWSGRPFPVPHLIKQRTVTEYARRFQLDTLVETGTFLGEMVYAVRKKFRRIYSVELNPTLADRARSIFASHPHITILEGDSAILLPQILSEINLPSLFWLDAHYSGGNTARGDVDTPVMQELDLILAHPVEGHIILIDDAREFVGKNDYPSIDQLESTLARHQLDWNLEVKHDIIRINKKSE